MSDPNIAPGIHERNPTPDTPAHTPLPWAVESDGDIVSIYGVAKNGDDWTICDMGLPVDLAGMNTDNLSQRILDEREANAAFIVRACNSHYSLVSALREARRIITEIDDYMKQPERGDWGTECACCMGELLDDDRATLASIDATLAALKDRTHG